MPVHLGSTIRRGIEIHLADVVAHREAGEGRVRETPPRCELEDLIPTRDAPRLFTRIAPTPSGGGSPARSSSTDSIELQAGQVEWSASSSYTTSALAGVTALTFT